MSANPDSECMSPASQHTVNTNTYVRSAQQKRHNKHPSWLDLAVASLLSALSYTVLCSLPPTLNECPSLLLQLLLPIELEFALVQHPLSRLPHFRMVREPWVSVNCACYTLWGCISVVCKDV